MDAAEHPTMHRTVPRQQRSIRPQMSTVLRLRNAAIEYCGSKHTQDYLSGGPPEPQSNSSKLKEGGRIMKITLTNMEVWPSEESQLMWPLLSSPIVCLEAAIYPVRGPGSHIEEEDLRRC